MKLYFSWKSIEKAHTRQVANPPYALHFSVIVPVRNESSNILNLLKDLNIQSLPTTKYEVIIVNDDSSDGTLELIKNHEHQFNFNLKILNLFVAPGFRGSHKKKALSLGIEASSGNYIVTTDGDCRVHKDWLLSLNSFLETSYAECVTGPVTFECGTLFQKMQTLEFAFLIGTGAASLNMGFPNMCNGANLAFSKKAFYEVKGYEGNIHIPSGDDEFLMHKIFEKFPRNVSFLKSPGFVVVTTAKSNLKALFFQRRRWAGKWSMYGDKRISLAAASYFIFNVLFIVSLIYVFYQSFPVYAFLILILVRIMINYIFLKSILNFLKKKLSLPVFLLTEMVYPFYVTVLGIASNFGHYEWKGRKI